MTEKWIKILLQKGEMRAEVVGFRLNKSKLPGNYPGGFDYGSCAINFPKAIALLY